MQPMTRALPDINSKDMTQVRTFNGEGWPAAWCEES